jgi:hypothetical protein
MVQLNWGDRKSVFQSFFAIAKGILNFICQWLGNFLMKNPFQVRNWYHLRESYLILFFTHLSEKNDLKISVTDMAG